MRRDAVAGWIAVATLALTLAPWVAAPAAASFANEFPRAKPVVSFHPRADVPFTLDQLRRALRAGVHGLELDLRWRAADSTVVCAHDAKSLGERPTFDEALSAILRFQGSSRSVQGDGLQFYLTLDLKEQGDAYHAAILAALGDRAPHWSTSATPGEEPRGITVVVSGSRTAFERAAPAAHLDLLCLIEGEDAAHRKRILDLSDREGPLAWVALQHPTTRERIQAIHQGRDAQFGGRFNVRVYGAGRQFAQAMDMGADAVNADLEEVSTAIAMVKAVASARAVPRFPASRTAAAIAAQAELPFWTLQGWKVEVRSRAEFEAAWRKRATARRARTPGWRGELLLRNDGDASVYRAIERWENIKAWRDYVTGAGARADTSLLDGVMAAGTSYSTMPMLELEDRFGAGPVAGNHIRFYHITARPGTARAFHRAFLRGNDAIRAAYPAALGASLVRDLGRADRLLEIDRWESEAAWRRFTEATPPDPDADATIRVAVGDIVTEQYEAIAIEP